MSEVHDGEDGSVGHPLATIVRRFAGDHATGFGLGLLLLGAARIFVLDDGRIVEEGTHDELVEAGGTYANLWHVQVGELDALPEDFLPADD